MKRAHCAIHHAGSWRTGPTGAATIGLAVASMVWAVRPAWGQSGWPNYPNNTAISVTSSGNVGIGTSNPSALLHTKTTNGYFLKMEAFSPFVRTYGIGTSATDGSFLVDDVTAVARRITISMDGNVGIGTTAPQYKLAVNGTVGAKDVIVTNSGWPDYVFRPGYRLRPLSEVGAYIQAHRHLPDIPSEEEVSRKGISLGEMQAKLLGKIEEITLHMIELDQQNRALQTQNRMLRERIANLEGGR